MKNNYFGFVFIILFICSFGFSFGQVSINTDGSAADPSAMLDIKSTSSGFLVPRMSFAELMGISSPADGLIAYSTTDHQLYIYSSIDGWQKLIIGEDDDWIFDVDDLYANNSGNVGIGNTTVLATHKLTVENNDDSDVLRLVGPGSYGFGAKLNFGDGEYTYIAELADDYLTVYGLPPIKATLS